MKTTELIQWQWKDYHTFHQSKTNLIIHIVTMPIFVLALLCVIYFAVQLQWMASAISFIVMLIAFGAQGYGHSLEANPSIPFANAKQAVQRIFLEQVINFPRYVINGGFIKALKKK